MNNLDKQYLNLLQDILDNGVIKKDRTGTGSISVFGRTIRHKMSEGFPLLTTKKVAFSQVKSELAWFLAGSSDIRLLWKYNNHIWDGDAYKKFVNTVEKNRPEGYTRPVLTKEEFIREITNNSEFGDLWGDLGPIYGKQWRSWSIKNQINPKTGEIFIGNQSIDQIQNIINDLINNPDSRRMIVNAWNVGEIDQMILPPCHFGFQVYTKELTEGERIKLYKNKLKVFNGLPPFGKLLDKENIPKRAISLKWDQRSVDTPLGLPFNIASYGLLLEMLAYEVNMIPDELIGHLGDVHIYLNQVEGVKEQLSREPKQLPKIQLQDGMACYLVGDNQDVVINGYDPHPAIKFPLSN